MSEKKGIPPTVGNFFLVLSSKLTQYDVAESKREMKRGRSNIYRLGHLLGAMQKAEAIVYTRHKATETMTPEIAKLFIGALAKNFTYNQFNNEFDLSPVRNVVKQLEAFLSHGQNPSLVGSGNVKNPKADKKELSPLAAATTKGEFAYTGSGGQFFIPHHRILTTQTKPSYFSVPLRGSAHVMGVWDQSTDKFVGWVLAEDLGYANVKAWMTAAGTDHRMLEPIKKFM
jgi:hypothetical protein